MLKQLTFRGAIVVVAASSFLSLNARAQAPDVKVYTPSQMADMATAMRMRADKTNTVATQPFESYGNVKTLLTLRDGDGQAEQHERFSDFFFVLDGDATLVTGGQILDSKTSGVGEVRGASVQGGKKVRLGKGDVVQIPPKIPHQLLVAHGTTFTYFVIKVEDRP